MRDIKKSKEENMPERISRKEFLKRTALTALSVAGISACGKVLCGPSFAEISAEEIPLGPDQMLLSVEELKTRGAANFMYNGKKAVLLYNNGEVRAFENICTHKGGSAKLVGDKLVCQWHGAVFDPLTGASQNPPAPKGSRLTHVPVEIRDGKVYLKG